MFKLRSEERKWCHVDRIIALKNIKCYKELLLSEHFTLNDSMQDHIFELSSQSRYGIEPKNRAKILLYYLCGPKIDYLGEKATVFQTKDFT